MSELIVSSQEPECDFGAALGNNADVSISLVELVILVGTMRYSLK